MKRWLVSLLLLTLFAAADSCAQGGSPGAAGAPRDTTRTGWRFVYIVRHGWYDADDPRDERVGKGLDSLGHAQARLIGARLAGMPIHVDRLVSSTFTRAAQTADDIGLALHMTPVRDSDLCECTPNANRPDYMRNTTPAEVAACEASLERVMARYFVPAGGREDKHDVLVAHGNVSRWLLCRILKIETTRWPDFNIGNGSITAYAVRPDGTVLLSSWSDTGHLPPAAQTWTGRGAGWSPPPPRRSGAASAVMAPHGGVVAPAPEATRDTLRYSRPTHR